MTYAEALDWLYATQLHGIKLGLQNARRLMEVLEIELHRAKFLHVAGTNGKGSVCAMIDSIGRAQGLKSGLFTSPHLIRFEERIRINGTPMPESEIAAGLTRIREKVATWEPHPTFFEITTALALEWFQRARTEIVVLETGLGGRLDATNVVTPAVSVLTAIDLDHQAWLGETLALVAGEKAGIIKPGVPAVSFPQQAAAAEVLAARADEGGGSLHVVEKPYTASPVGLRGSHQLLNAALAVEALRAAQVPVTETAIRDGLRTIYWPGRFQEIGSMVLDGAHNPSALRRLAMTWREAFGSEKATVIFGALRDKDVPGMLETLSPIADNFLLVPTANPRSCTVEELADFLNRSDSSTPFRIAETLGQALAAAEKNGSRILATGSLFLVGEMLALLEQESKPRSSLQ
jgi:dihydrofolate synthase/folylpolyglutamate synthase